MSVDGFFEFGCPGKNLLLEEGDSIKIKLRGTDINGIFAEFSLFFNGDKIGSGKTSSNWEEFLYIADTSYLLKKVTVSFDNDAIFGKLDRNLYVGPLSINDSLIPARSENNRYYDKYNPEKQEGFPVNFRSVAGLAANSLLEKGISEEKVIVLPSEISDKNRTYNSALAVKEWLDEQSPENISFNLVSENIHARRSWILFRYALKGTEAEVGIITENASNDRNQNLKINNENLIREIIGNIYYRTLFRL
jgi:hypothetical protein